MNRKLLSLLISLTLLLGTVLCTLPACTTTTPLGPPIGTISDTTADTTPGTSPESIVILYENDVHCAVDGYAKLAAMKTEMAAAYDHVGVVSVGDYVQGGSLGAVSQGEYIIDLMNLVGYDAVALGNHEFDYRLPRLMELAAKMLTKPTCCNFRVIGEENSVFDAYTMVTYGELDIAYVGVTTPSTITSSAPGQFKDEDGNYVYTFNVNTLYDTVQSSIDAAREAGAEYVVALTHIGYEEDDQYEDVVDLIENTSGLDVVLDGHSHTVIEGMTVKDEDGRDVRLSSTGTKFEYIGKLTIEDGEIDTALVKTETYEKTDERLTARIAAINEEYAELGNRKIGVSDVDLITHDADGNRLVRQAETNLGNLCSDAFRLITGADIGYVNGGGIRAPIAAGDVTFNDILSLYPFNNQVVVCELSGQALLDMLEVCFFGYPEEDGSFPHVSGVTFSVDTSIPTSVQMDENGVFTGMGGAYRVYDVRVLDSESGEYLPLDLGKTYTLASHNHLILEQGGGMSMLEGVRILQNDGTLDVELMERYITENLGGHIGQEYREVRNAITFTEGQPQ